MVASATITTNNSGTTNLRIGHLVSRPIVSPTGLDGNIVWQHQIAESSDEGRRSPVCRPNGIEGSNQGLLIVSTANQYGTRLVHSSPPSEKGGLGGFPGAGQDFRSHCARGKRLVLTISEIYRRQSFSSIVNSDPIRGEIPLNPPFPKGGEWSYGRGRMVLCPDE